MTEETARRLGNTRDDLLRTIVPQTNEAVICPACGASMRLRTPGSFELNLYPRFRHECNQVLRQYSAFLEQLEVELQARNLPGSAQGGNDAAYAYTRIDDLPTDLFRDGLYSTETATFIGQHWWQLFDRYKFAELIHRDLPTLKELRTLIDEDPSSPSLQAGAARPFDAVVNSILGTFEPRDFTGYLLSLVFDQPHVRGLLSEVATPEAKGHAEFLELTRDQRIAPRFANYLDILDDVLGDDKLMARFLGDMSPVRRDTLRSQVHRARLLLILLLGHRSQAAVNRFAGLYDYLDPFTLPQRTVLAPRFAIQLFNSAAMTSLAGIGLSDDYIELLRGREIPEAADDAEATIQIEQLLAEDTHRLLRFVCRGPSGRPPQVSTAASGPYGPVDPDYCGWFPKEVPTHPVVFIGSPGTSKSTLMLTGLVRFFNLAHALGADVSFHSAKDGRAYTDYINQFWYGIMPSPTPKGSRESIHFRVEANDDPANGAEFVFTDIPGEKVSRSTGEEGADPFVLSVLKNAETILFLFDLSIEPAVHKALKYSPAKESWKAYFANYGRVVYDRLPKAMKENPPEESKLEENSSARVLQFDLLDRMITDLREMRGELGQEQGPNFVCVIPKADLYASGSRVADREEDAIKFLTSFYRKLQDNGVLSPSSNGGETEADSLDWWQSNGGFGAHLVDDTAIPDDRGMSDAIVNWQFTLVQEISAAAREGLAGIGSALGREAQRAEREALSGLINQRLIRHLESVFGADHVFFLPISAQGADAPAAGSGDGPRLNHPPNAKLSEYAFILPVLLARLARRGRPA